MVEQCHSFVGKYNFQMPSSLGTDVTACAAGSMFVHMHGCTYCMYQYGFFVTELLGIVLGLTKCPIREVS